MLSFTQFPSLRNVDGSAVVDVTGSFPIVVIRASDTAAVALSATCTHQGCILQPASSRSEIHCDCHNGDFAFDGRVLDGPPVVPLPTYVATIGPDAITVQIDG